MTNRYISVVMNVITMYYNSVVTYDNNICYMVSLTVRLLIQGRILPVVCIGVIRLPAEPVFLR
jgi:hypothetical protein